MLLLRFKASMVTNISSEMYKRLRQIDSLDAKQHRGKPLAYLQNRQINHLPKMRRDQKYSMHS
jgi:hypothetical protein